MGEATPLRPSTRDTQSLLCLASQLLSCINSTIPRLRWLRATARQLQHACRPCPSRPLSLVSPSTCSKQQPFDNALESSANGSPESSNKMAPYRFTCIATSPQKPLLLATAFTLLLHSCSTVCWQRPRSPTHNADQGFHLCAPPAGRCAQGLWERACLAVDLAVIEPVQRDAWPKYVACRRSEHSGHPLQHTGSLAMQLELLHCYAIIPVVLQQTHSSRS